MTSMSLTRRGKVFLAFAKRTDNLASDDVRQLWVIKKILLFYENEVDDIEEGVTNDPVLNQIILLRHF